jgi:hypothetical protein
MHPTVLRELEIALEEEVSLFWWKQVIGNGKFVLIRRINLEIFMRSRSFGQLNPSVVHNGALLGDSKLVYLEDSILKERLDDLGCCLDQRNI